MKRDKEISRHYSKYSEKGDGLSDFLMAVRNNDRAEANLIISNRPDCIHDVWKSSSSTALHIAAANGNIDIVTDLLAIPGVNPHARDAWDRTPLEIAIIVGRESVVEALFEATFPENYVVPDPLDVTANVMPFPKPSC